MTDYDQFSARAVDHEEELLDIEDDTGESTRDQILSDSEIEKKYNTLSIDIYTSPCFAATSKGPLPGDFEHGDFGEAYHRRYRGQDDKFNWKPRFSGSFGRWMLVSVMWIAVACHFLTCKLVQRHQAFTFGALAPAVIISLIVKFTETAIADETRRESYQLNSDLNRRRLHKILLFMHRGLVIFVLAPFLSMPIWSTQYLTQFSSRNSALFDEAEMSMVGIPSWDEAIGSFGASLATNSLASQPDDDRYSWRRSIFPWEAKFQKEKFDGPNTINFTHPVYAENLKDTQELKNWGTTVVGEAAMLPIIPRTGLPQNSLFGNLISLVQLLSVSVECTTFEPSQNGPWKFSEEQVLTFQNCTAPIKIDRHEMSRNIRRRFAEANTAALRDMETVLRQTQRYMTDYQRAEKRYNRLRKHSEILKDPREIQVFKPAWAFPDDAVSDESCRRKHFFVAAGRPISSIDETTISQDDLQIGLCERHYSTASQVVKMGLGLPQLSKATMSSPLFVPHVNVSNYNKLSWQDDYANDEIYRFKQDTTSVLAKIALFAFLIKRDPKFGWSPLRAETAVKLDEVLRTSFDSFNMTDDWWPYHLLDYSYYDDTTGTLQDVGALAQGSKIFSSTFAEKMSTAAGLRLEELLIQDSTFSKGDKGLKHLKGQVEAVFYRYGNFQSSAWFKIWIIFIGLLSTSFVAASSYYTSNKTSGFPWNYSSIAAKAVLLSRSRIRSAFSTSENEPEDIYRIPGLKIGHWTLDSGHSSYYWHLDTMCNEVLVKREPDQITGGKLYKRYDSRSLPHIIGWRSICTKVIFIALTMFAMVSFARWDPKQEAFKTFISGNSPGFSLLPLICGSNCGLIQSFKTYIWFVTAPLLAAFIIMNWWNGFNIFYSERQPWAGLFDPRPARFNLTLDYGQSYFRLGKAIINRHWLIALLSLGSILNLLLPVLVAALYHLEWHTLPMNNIRLARNHDWNLDAINTTFKGAPGNIFLSTLLDTVDAPGKHKWSFNDTALLPIDLMRDESHTPSLRTGYWQAKTKSISGKLSCTQLNYSLETWHPVDQHDKTDGKRLKLHLPDNIATVDGLNITLDPCKFTHNANQNGITPKFGVGTKMAVCTRWNLQTVTVGESNETLPMWFIGSSYGNLKNWDNVSGPEFDSTRTNFLALMCRPEIYVGEGNLTLVSNEDGTQKLEDAYIYDYQMENQTQLHSSNSWVFSKLLNDSLHRSGKITDPVILPQPSIVTPSFIGDVMGYLAYRNTLLQDSILDFSTRLENAMSCVYSRIFRSLIEETDWLTDDVSSVAEVTPIIWYQHLVTNWTVLYILSGLGFFYIISIIILGIPRKKYTFPISPEPLENALFFLYRSSIFRHLEKIPHSEKMSIAELHKSVEKLGLKYTFGQYGTEDTGSVHFGVNVPETFAHGGSGLVSSEDRHPELERSENEDEGEEEEESVGDLEENARLLEE